MFKNRATSSKLARTCCFELSPWAADQQYQRAREQAILRQGLRTSVRPAIGGSAGQVPGRLEAVKRTSVTWDRYIQL